MYNPKLFLPWDTKQKRNRKCAASVERKTKWVNYNLINITYIFFINIIKPLRPSQYKRPYMRQRKSTFCKQEACRDLLDYVNVQNLS